MRSIPVDMARVPVVIAMGPAEPVTDQDGAARADRDGQPLYSVPVAVSVDDGDASVIQVRVAGDRPEVRAGMVVRLVELAAAPWEIGGRHGMVFRARAVLPGPGGAPAGPPPSRPSGGAPAGGPAQVGGRSA